uniref:hypothetical protein n=1 Tax=Streptomyces sp. WI03-5b TaxID=462946 RepID=UPI0039F571F6
MIIAKAVDVVIGFTDKEEYSAVPGQDEERAYDLRAAERLDALTAGDREKVAALRCGRGGAGGCVEGPARRPFTGRAARRPR